MRYIVVKNTLNTSDRTVDMTVEFRDDVSNALIQTKLISIDADKFDQQAVLLRLNGELDREIRRATPFPLTQAQADAVALNLTNRKPG